jgi:hypothetical protein
LLNYLNDVVDGASFYSDWVNADLYEQTTERFGICVLPGFLSTLYLQTMCIMGTESIHIRLRMAPYTDQAARGPLVRPTTRHCHPTA